VQKIAVFEWAISISATRGAGASLEHVDLMKSRHRSDLIPVLALSLIAVQPAPAQQVAPGWFATGEWQCGPYVRIITSTDQFVGKHVGPGGMAAGAGEAGDETSLDRIEAAAEDDRNGRGRGFGRECRRCEVWRDDDGYPAADQIGRQFRQPIIVIVRPEVFDGHVLALDIASFAEPFSECCDKICAPFGRTTEEKPDHWPRRLLRVRRERPRCRTAEQRDELAAPHSITSSAIASRPGGKLSPNALAV